MFYFISLFLVFIVSIQASLVQIDQGLLNGTVLKSKGGHEYFSFYNIPYAEPPVGPRFQPAAIEKNRIPGKPVHLVTIDEDSTFILNEKNVEEILLAKDVGDRKVVVVSIAGAFKEGKSFLLGFFLRYLNVSYNSDHTKRTDSYWLGDESQPLQGFTFKTSQERTTTGIQMWSEPFLTTLPNGEKVAILLLDTQGLFDGNTPYAVNVKIFGLTSLISSIQMFNIMQKVQEDKLQLLKFVTDYGSIVAKNPGNVSGPSFQKFIFLIRDWANSHETPYGFEGGQTYLNKVLKTTNNQHEELRSVRKQIKSCFTNISCFLMPYPGERVVKNPKFTGQLSDVDEEFKISLRELIQSMLSTENLVLKEINGETVTISELISYLKRYVDALNSRETLEPKSIINANAEMSYQKALKTALGSYDDRMKALLHSPEMIIETGKLMEKSAEYRDIAVKIFNNHTKLHDPKLDESFMAELQREIDEMYSSYREMVTLHNSLVITNREIKESKETNRKMIDNLKTEMEKKTATREELERYKNELDEHQRKFNSILRTKEENERRIMHLEQDREKRRKSGFLKKVWNAFKEIFE